MLGKRGIDHLVLAVHDLNAARRTYQALGFTVTPVAEHPFGTSNALVQLQSGFLELLAVTDTAKISPPTPTVFSFGHFNQQFLERRDGLSMLVYKTHDARADQRGFKQAGLKTYDPFDFGRQATLPDGSRVDVSFSLALVEHEPSADEVMFFCCQQHAPEHFWKPDYQKHLNSASDIVDVYMLTRDLKAAADYFQRLHGNDSVEHGDHGLVCQTADNQVLVFNDAGYREYFDDELHRAPEKGMAFAGFSVRVVDVEQLKHQLLSSTQQWRTQGTRLVSQSLVEGTTVVFESA